ncbi:MAG: hypothetical protein ACW967_09875 [Candidatus Hodarchaeales archaeon]|jgi:hypothetical protein
MSTVSNLLTKDTSLDSIIIIGLGASLAFDLAYLFLFDSSIFLFFFAFLRIIILIDFTDPRRPSSAMISKLGSLFIFLVSLLLISYGVYDYYRGNITDIIDGLLSFSIFSEFSQIDLIVFLSYFLISLFVLLYFLIKLLTTRNKEL